MKTLHVIDLVISDFKRIEAFDASALTGDPITVTGDNGMGKSSILDAMLNALQGRNGPTVKKPIRNGAESAMVKLTLSDGKRTSYTVTKSFTESGEYLSVKDEAGVKVEKPQKFLDDLIDHIVDPAEFANASDARRTEILRSILPESVAEIEASIKAAAEERTVLGREKTRASKVLESLEKPEDNWPTEIVSASTLIAERDAMDSDLIARDRLIQRAERLAGEIESTKAQLEHLEDEFKTTVQLRNEQEDSYDKVKHEALCLRVEGIDAENEKATKAARYDDALAEARCANQAHEKSEEAIHGLRKDLKKTISEADLGVDELSIEEDGSILFGGVVLDQLSTAEKLVIGSKLAMRGDTDLGIVVIREGALISEANLKIITDEAEATGHQVWIEKFQEKESEDSSFHIVEGNVA